MDAERVNLVNRIGAVLATLGVRDYDPLRRDRRERLATLRTALGVPLPPHASAKITRILGRLDLVRGQIAELDQQRDAVLEDATPDKAGEMIQQLARLRGIGVQSATVLVREAFVREFANGKALGSYAGLAATPYSSGGVEREQGMGFPGTEQNKLSCDFAVGSAGVPLLGNFALRQPFSVEGFDAAPGAEAVSSLAGAETALDHSTAAVTAVGRCSVSWMADSASESSADVASSRTRMGAFR